MLRAVLYISDSTFTDLTAEQQELNNIDQYSKSTNKNNQISGVLAYYQKKFFHVLEGPSNEIESLLTKIKNDERNKNVSVLLDVKQEKRIYDDWDLICSHDKKQSARLGKFLQSSIEILPMLKQEQHDTLEEFIDNIFY